MERLADALIQFDPGNPADPLSPLNPASPLNPLNLQDEARKKKRDENQHAAPASTETASENVPRPVMVEEHSGAWLLIGAAGIALLLGAAIAIIRRLS